MRITKHFPVLASDHVDFDVKSGKRCSENGAGKAL
jgi:ABC-type uncharacterized transport system ATPase subunit